MLYIREAQKGVVFKVRVQPRSSKNQIAGLFDDALKIRLTAPRWRERPLRPVAHLAKVLEVPRSQVKIAAGQSSRNKMVSVEGVSREQALKALGL